MPSPAANSIATQENVLNSGFSPSLPSTMRPYGDTATASRNTSTSIATTLNSQPAFTIVQS